MYIVADPRAYLEGLGLVALPGRLKIATAKPKVAVPWKPAISVKTPLAVRVSMFAAGLKKASQVLPKIATARPSVVATAPVVAAVTPSPIIPTVPAAKVVPVMFSEPVPVNTPVSAGGSPLISLEKPVIEAVPVETASFGSSPVLILGLVGLGSYLLFGGLGGTKRQSSRRRRSRRR
jgi:hypothetical protein